MTAKSNMRDGAGPSGSNASRPAPSGELRAIQDACKTGVRLRPRRGQSIDVALHPEGTLWLIESGCLLLQRHLRGSGRQILLVLLPGDVFDRAWLPVLPRLDVVASAPSELIRAHEPNGAGSGARGALARQVLGCLAEHSACLGRLTGEERVAAFLVSLARRVRGNGQPMRSVSLPLSRQDLGDCLALNPDTVSRIMSDLRRRRVLARLSRNELVISNWDALVKLSPFEASPD